MYIYIFCDIIRAFLRVIVGVVRGDAFDFEHKLKLILRSADKYKNMPGCTVAWR